MAKYKLGSNLTTNSTYDEEYQKIFHKQSCKKGGIVLDIYEDGKNEPIYFFTEPDKYGNREGIAENFLKLV